MNRVFNVAVDADDWQSRTGVSGGGVIDELLRSLDYRVYGILGYDYMFRGPLGSQYDYSIPQHSIPSYQLLLSGIWMGEFRFDIGLQTLDHEEYVQAKREVFAAPGEGPLFVYTHSAIPGHSQNSGVCLPDEIEVHGERLREANAEMRQDIAAIITNDPDAIIIVAGDHGPYLTKNCLILNDYDPAEITRADIQDRFGAFLAMRWPVEDYSEFDQITVLQDISQPSSPGCTATRHCWRPGSSQPLWTPASSARLSSRTASLPVGRMTASPYFSPENSRSRHRTASSRADRGLLDRSRAAQQAQCQGKARRVRPGPRLVAKLPRRADQARRVVCLRQKWHGCGLPFV